jgi:uroporphyrinogen-III synthase
MNTQSDQHEVLELAFLRVVEFISDVVACDSCFIYVVEDGNLVLKASKNPHSEVMGRLKLRIGQGITGWVAEHRKPVVIARNAGQDPRFLSFTELPEDHRCYAATV